MTATVRPAPEKVTARVLPWARVRLSLVLVMSALLARVGVARSETIAAASTDARFVTALTVTFASAGMAVSPARVAWSADVADVTRRARELADANHATATIALAFGTADTTLIAYDRALDRVLLRVLPYRAPLNDEQSAEIALMARTMLRMLRVTPDVDLPPPHASEAAAIRERAVAELGAPVPPAPAGDLLALELGAGARIGAIGATAREEAALGLVVRPDAAGGVVAAILVPAAEVVAPGFMGRVADTAVAASARLSLRVAPRLAVAGSAGLAVHRIHLGGTANGGAIDVTRYDPALRAGFDARFELRSGLEVGASASLEGLLRYQAYTVAGVQVLDIPAARVSIAVSLLARIL